MTTNQGIQNVLITGARAPVTLHLSRLFQKKGIKVFLADSISYPISKASNSVSKFFLLPSPKFKYKDFVQRVNHIINTCNIDLIIPTCEETFYLSMAKDAIKCAVFTDNLSTLQLLHNKFEFITYANQKGLKTPFTITTDNPTRVQQAIKHLGINHLVLKPIYSRFSDHILFVSKQDVLTDNSQLLHPGWIAQQHIEGSQFCSYSIAQKGKVLAHTVYKTEFTAGIGATVAFSHQHIPAIYTFVSTLVEKLGFTGQIAFDFIEDANGEFYPIECNPRATSGLHLFSEEIVDTIIGNIYEDSTVLTPLDNTKYAIKLALLIYGSSYWKSYKTYKKWNKTLFSHSDIVYDKQDKRPFYYQFYSMYKIWRASKKNQCSLLEQTTYDISWDGEVH